jgi:cysteine desulfurase
LKSGELLFGNPSSQHAAGKASRKIINDTRAKVFSSWGLSEKNHQLFFHSGATEGIATFASSFAEWARLAGKELLICYSKLDHPAVLALGEKYLGAHVKFLELKLGSQLEYLHQLNFDVIKDKKDNNPDLIILYHHLWVHNETGVVSPLSQLALFKSIPDLYIHVDAVQTPGKIPDWSKLAMGDVYTFSGHKFGALKGIGFSFFSKQICFYPFITGGGQQFSLRSGTENISGIQSLGLALDDLAKIDVAATIGLREELEEFLVRELKGLGEVVSTLSQKNSNTIYFYFHHHTSDIALALFDINGLMISAGSACSSGAAKASALLVHLGLKEVARNGLRISFSPNLSRAELEDIQAKLVIVLTKLRH